MHKDSGGICSFGRQAMGPAAVCLGSAVAATGALAQTVAADNQPIEVVNVTAQRTGLNKLPDIILDTPQSINVVPLKVIQEQVVASQQDALRNVPVIALNAGEGGSHGDQVNLRGFSAGDDFFLDGLRDTGFYTRDAFNYEAVDVYKGPASTLFGRGSTGGVINQISKTPQLYPVDAGIFTVGSNDEVRGTADVNYVLGDSSALRMNAMGMSAGVADRDFVQYRRWGFAPSIALGIDEPTTFTLGYLHQYENNVPDFGIPFVSGKPTPVPRNFYYGLPSDDRQISRIDVVTGTMEHDFNASISISNKARYGNYFFDTRQTAPTYGDANCFTGTAPFAGAPLCTGAAGDIPVTATNTYFPVPGTPLDQIFVRRDRPSASGTVQTLMNETDATWKFTTGSIAHTLVGGIELDKEDADLTRYANQDDVIAATPLLHPDPHEAFPGRQTLVSSRPDTKTDTVGFYAVDTIDFDPHWSLLAALRWDRFHASYTEPLAAVQFKHTDYVTSPRAALVYKPDENSSLYFSYGTSFNPSAENLSLSSRTADLGPEKDRTFELGGKTLLLGGMLSLTGALFDTQMTNARIADPLNPALQTLAGKLKVRGAEANVAGNLTEHWEIMAGYTYLDGSSKGLFGAGMKGPIPNNARNQANLWTTYDFDSGWKIGGGMNYLGKRDAFKDQYGVAHVPSYVTFDAMIAYQVNDHLQLQVNGYNLADNYYFTNSYFTRTGENHVLPGAGRTVTLSAIVNL